MMREKQRYTISLLGTTYEILSDEASENVWAAVQRVNTLLQDSATQTKSPDGQCAAVFAALTLANTVQKMERELQQQTQQVHQLVRLLEQEVGV
jgi:cell division protein ZapA (FtsZ GTPase activity inhibitor)